MAVVLELQANQIVNIETPSISKAELYREQTTKQRSNERKKGKNQTIEKETETER